MNTRTFPRLRIKASDLYSYFQPSICARRVYLGAHGVRAAAASAYDEVLSILGERHEQKHLAAFPAFVDLSAGCEHERLLRTGAEIAKGSPVIYQGLFRALAQTASGEVEVIGSPDFLIRDGKGYIVRDSKLSRRVSEGEHPEVLRQVELYGWLYQAAVCAPPVALQVHTGTGEIIEIPYDGGARAVDALEVVVGAMASEIEPYSPVGWTKCHRCRFYDRCWSQAEKERSIALVPGVDQGLAAALHEHGVDTIDALLGGFGEESLAALHRPWGAGSQRVGRRARAILDMAAALASGKERVLKVPDIPASRRYVMFDVEGLPPQMDDLDKTYLWGLQVFGGRKPGLYRVVTAGFGNQGERTGWKAFLRKAGSILRRYGDIPFVHWHHYERVRIDTCIRRYGDPAGIAARVRRNLFDLLPVVRESVALPLFSYSLKVIEKYVGFRRSQNEYGGDWAMAKYIEATESGDHAARKALLAQIATYNREDLEAMWAVFQWARSRRTPEQEIGDAAADAAASSWQPLLKVQRRMAGANPPPTSNAH